MSFFRHATKSVSALRSIELVPSIHQRTSASVGTLVFSRAASLSGSGSRSRSDVGVSADMQWQAAMKKLKLGAGGPLNRSDVGGVGAVDPSAVSRPAADAGRPLGGPHDLQEHTWKHAWAVNEVMAFGRHTKVTKGGRIFSVSALVLLGNGKGSAGYGYGKALTAQQAVARAQADAERNIISIPLFEGRTVSNEFKVKQDGVRLAVIPLPKGHGIHAGSTNETLCRAFGLTDILVKSYGRRNMKSWVRAFFAGVFKNAKPTNFQREALGKR